MLARLASHVNVSDAVSVARLPEEIRLRHAAVAEVELAERPLLKADGGDLAALERRLVPVDDEPSDEIAPRCVAAERGDDEGHVEDRPVGDPELGAAEHVVVAVGHRRGLDAARIGADVGLAGGGAGDPRAGEQRREEARLLLGGAAHLDALGRALVAEQREAQHRRQRLVEQPEHHVGEAASAVGLGHAGAGVAERRDRTVEIEHRRFRQRPVRWMRGEDGIDVARDHAAGGLDEHPLGVGEVEVHLVEGGLDGPLRASPESGLRGQSPRSKRNIERYAIGSVRHTVVRLLALGLVSVGAGGE